MITMTFLAATVLASVAANRNTETRIVTLWDSSFPNGNGKSNQASWTLKPHFEKKDVVMIDGLTSRSLSNLNGRRGTIYARVPGSNCWKVKVKSAYVTLKPDKLTLVRPGSGGSGAVVGTHFAKYFDYPKYSDVIECELKQFENSGTWVLRIRVDKKSALAKCRLDKWTRELKLLGGINDKDLQRTNGYRLKSPVDGGELMWKQKFDQHDRVGHRVKVKIVKKGGPRRLLTTAPCLEPSKIPEL